jgi:carbonic anhydrase
MQWDKDKQGKNMPNPDDNDPSLSDLLIRNQEWAKSHIEKDPDFFHRLTTQQKPKYLWIGCSDARVPANQIVGLAPGELFVHRNIANQIIHTDFNSYSVIQFAVDVLKVEHIIVCGHYGCGGIQAATEEKEFGFVDSWLRPIKDTCFRYKEELAKIQSPAQKHDRLCELNVITQVENVSCSKVVQRAWRRKQPLKIHGWVYSLSNGLVKDLQVDKVGLSDIDSTYMMSPKS